MRTSVVLITLFSAVFTVAVEASARSKSYFCSQNLVDQFDKKLLEEFPTTPGLCTATCIANLTILLGSPLKSNGIKNVVEVVNILKKESKKTNPYNPNSDGTTFIQMLQALSALAKKTNSPIEKITAKTHEEITSEEKNIIKNKLNNVTFSMANIKPTDINSTPASWMVLGLVSWMGPHRLSHDEHDVLAIWDEINNELMMIDPAHSNKISRWVLLKGTKTYPARLRRVSGPYYKGHSVVVVHDWVKILTKN